MLIFGSFGDQLRAGFKIPQLNPADLTPSGRSTPPPTTAFHPKQPAGLPKGVLISNTVEGPGQRALRPRSKEYGLYWGDREPLRALTRKENAMIRFLCEKDKHSPENLVASLGRKHPAEAGEGRFLPPHCS